MSYSKFRKLKQLNEEFGINYENIPFLPLLNSTVSSGRLLADLEDASLTALTTEKAKSEHIVVPIFGCVTNAFSWCFLKLENKNLYIDPNYVPLTFTKPHEVLAVLQWILDESLKPYQP